MKNYIIFFNVLLLLIISGCGNENLIQDDIEKDIEQAILLLDTAYEEKRALKEEETVVLDKFNDKYIVGKFLLNDGTEYEMNDLEKEIANDVRGLKHLTIPEGTLASEEDLYTTIRKRVDDNLKATDIPPEIKDRYPTYEIYSGVHPQVKDDAKKVINAFDKIVNSESDDYNTTDMYMLNSFIKEYEKMDFKIDDKNYLLNDDGWDILYAFMELKEDIEAGSLSPITADLFNKVKEIVVNN